MASCLRGAFRNQATAAATAHTAAGAPGRAPG
uniref:Uncharacterized protein n=1 Tax=Setaria viridis TaxID=4556 RepID=A0A4U6W7R2_SETVI|nr:hypothetical protein SEVIR_1G134050v2 [Setaria viridis]